MKDELIKWAENEMYSEDHEDLGGEAIANVHYKTKFEAFMFGYNQALKEVIEHLK